jgi:subtilisin family serine protease/PBP1b-binding outer membrane lipoprotein LpoB|nr:S8 family serine peptidase [Candidatus Krumholzibacteria bacterium]
MLNRKSLTLMAALAALLLALLVGGCSSHGKAPTDAPPPPPPVPAAPVDKVPVDSLDDLPVHSYELTGTVMELLDDPAAMAALRAQVRQDVESDLATYAITDEATLQGMYGRLVTLNLVEGRDQEAVNYLDKIKALEDKEAARLMNGLTTRSMIEAKGMSGAQPGDPEFMAAYRLALTERVNALPWDVVQDNIKSGKGRAEYMNENLLLGVVQAQLEPAASAMGSLSSDLAGSVIGIRYALDTALQLNPVVAEVYGEYIAANNKEKVNIWAERDLVLDANQNLTPVVVGIWDSGVDAAVFGDAMFVNPNESFNGEDDDGNGFIDDINGIAFDLNGIPSTEMLHPLGDQEGKLDEMFESMQGFQDMTSAIDSPEASATRAKLGQMAPEKMGDFLTTLSFGGLYSHGTHVAGIAAAGNPFARLLIARITFDYHNIPQAMTVETAKRLARDYMNTTAYFQAHGVRVVNMSWGWSFKEIEGGLEANGIGATAEERAAMAREMIGILSDGLRAAIATTPDILYVSAAGNDDNDVEFDVVIPSNFDLPNLMVVGAVDQAGDPTSFTSGGRNVKVYANGFQVESYVPGGGTMKMSGTSMASPNVCNLAGKLFALDPTLNPDKVIRIIEESADPHPDHYEILRMNPKAAAAMVK